jgi:hypothetical protein
MIPLTQFKPAAQSMRSAAIALTALLGMVSVAQAASTGAVTLSGTVGVSCNITVAPQGPYNALDLTSSPAILNVATVTEQCTDPKGYRVTLTSTNGKTNGLLAGTTAGNSDTVSYSIFYGGAAIHLANSSATVTNANGKTTNGGAINSLAISYTGTSTLSADTYSDTLTFTITGK